MNEPLPETTTLPRVSLGERLAAGVLALLVAGTAALWWGNSLFDPPAFMAFLGHLQLAWEDTVVIVLHLEQFSADRFDVLLFTAYASSLLGLIFGWFLLLPLAVSRAAGRCSGWWARILWWLALTHGAMALYCLCAEALPLPKSWKPAGVWVVRVLFRSANRGLLVPALELPLAASVLWFTRTKRRSDSAGGAEARE
jgi:hypothetical protein